MKSLATRLNESLHINEGWGGNLNRAEIDKWMNSTIKSKYNDKLDGTNPKSWDVDDFITFVVDSAIDAKGKFKLNSGQESDSLGRMLELNRSFDFSKEIVSGGGYFSDDSLNTDFKKYGTITGALADVWREMKKVARIKESKSDLIGSVVRITSDNDNYKKWMKRDLKITHASNSGRGYDDSMSPQYLCDLEDAKTGEECPFSLYEYEFDEV